ncbi:hypothetical protein ZIOFF_053379 [Zingiber officinale]|uniref:Autophagy-related protein n=1 Tax=Zingiber officinale TaxID=94328 RepID=A0A8J5FCA5_ZINOF|nr:hypothetical protein ZIOFF_053379 [Zingiber officinale]
MRAEERSAHPIERSRRRYEGRKKEGLRTWRIRNPRFGVFKAFHNPDGHGENSQPPPALGLFPVIRPHQSPLGPTCYPEERLQESKEMVAKYPDRVPVIVEKFSGSNLPELEKKKYLVPRDMSVGQFIHVLSRRLRLAAGKALFVFVNNTLPQTAAIMDSMYESYKDEDGFLYMCYSSEKTFG